MYGYIDLLYFFADICSIKWVTCDGIEYRKPCVLIVAAGDDDPVFGRLEEIYVVAAENYLKVAMQCIVRCCAHFHAYVITSKSPKEYQLVKISDIFSRYPLYPRSVSTLSSCGRYAVVLKHAQ